MDAASSHIAEARYGQPSPYRLHLILLIANPRRARCGSHRSERRLGGART